MVLRFLRWCRNRFRSARILRGIEQDLPSVWPKILQIWSTAARVYNGLIGPAGTMKFEAAILTALFGPRDAIPLLIGGLSHPSPMAAGYCLVVLCQMEHVDLAAVPRQILERQELLMVQTGCMGFESRLGEIAARQLFKMHDES